MRIQTSTSFGPLFQAALIVAFAICLAVPASAKRAVPENLGNGLDRLVESNLAVKAGAPANINGFATTQAASYATMALVDKATGRYVVDIVPDGSVPLATLQASLQTSFPLLTVKAVETNYRGHGIIESLVTVDDVPAIARTPGIGSVILQLKPQLNAGQAIARRQSAPGQPDQQRLQSRRHQGHHRRRHLRGRHVGQLRWFADHDGSGRRRHRG